MIISTKSTVIDLSKFTQIVLTDSTHRAVVHLPDLKYFFEVEGKPLKVAKLAEVILNWKYDNCRTIFTPRELEQKYYYHIGAK